jgi:hypothetical protein
MYKGHKWYWCGKETGGKCEKWRAHKPKECRGAAPPGKRKEKHGESKDKDKSKSKDRLAKKLKIAQAYVARIEKQVVDASSSSSEAESE